VSIAKGSVGPCEDFGNLWISFVEFLLFDGSRRFGLETGVESRVVVHVYVPRSGLYRCRRKPPRRQMLKPT
jgi:hypothetical protein